MSFNIKSNECNRRKLIEEIGTRKTSQETSVIYLRHNTEEYTKAMCSLQQLQD